MGAAWRMAARSKLVSEILVVCSRTRIELVEHAGQVVCVVLLVRSVKAAGPSSAWESTDVSGHAASRLHPVVKVQNSQYLGLIALCLAGVHRVAGYCLLD